LLANERAFTQTLESNEKGFRRSQGDQWVDSMREDFTHLASLDGSLVELNAQLPAQGHALAQEKSGLAAAIPLKIDDPMVAGPTGRSKPSIAAAAGHAATR